MTGDQPSGAGSDSGLPRHEVSLNKASLAKNPLVRGVHTNLSTEIIQITEDKALICLMQNFDRLRARDAWQVPASILATLGTVMMTAVVPEAKFGLSKETWTALGWVVTVLTGAWLIVDLVRLVLGKHVDPQSIVKELKTITATMPEGGKRPSARP